MPAIRQLAGSQPTRLTYGFQCPSPSSGFPFAFAAAFGIPHIQLWAAMSPPSPPQSLSHRSLIALLPARSHPRSAQAAQMHRTSGPACAPGAPGGVRQRLHWDIRQKKTRPLIAAAGGQWWAPHRRLPPAARTTYRVRWQHTQPVTASPRYALQPSSLLSHKQSSGLAQRSSSSRRQRPIRQAATSSLHPRHLLQKRSRRTCSFPLWSFLRSLVMQQLLA